MNPAQIVAEWRRGCSNTQQHYRNGTPTASGPEDCAECTAAAMRAVARWVDEQVRAPTDRVETDRDDPDIHGY